MKNRHFSRRAVLGIALLALTERESAVAQPINDRPMDSHPSRSSSAEGEENTIFAKAKMGPSFYLNTPISGVVALDLSAGFISEQGWGVSGIGLVNFSGSTLAPKDAETAIKTSIQSFFLGVAPTYSVHKGGATLSFGLGLGLFSVSTTTATVTRATEAEVQVDQYRNQPRLGIAPYIALDVTIIDNLVGTFGVQYLAGFGPSPAPSVVSPMAGIGYLF